MGVTRAPMSSEDFRTQMSRDIEKFSTNDIDPQLWQWFEKRLYYLAGDFQDTDTYSRLKELLMQVDQECSTQGNYLYYLATAPDFFCDIIWQLGSVGLAQEDGSWRRVIIEKPFGHDLESARALNKNISTILKESQIYRIDHYLGKETVQNILVFRFGNGLFEPILESPLYRSCTDYSC